MEEPGRGRGRVRARAAGQVRGVAIHQDDPGLRGKAPQRPGQDSLSASDRAYRHSAVAWMDE